MGDRCSVTIKFGGRVTRSQAEELVRLLADEEFQHNGETVDPEDMDGWIADLDEEFWAEEVNWGSLEAIESYCEANGIEYEKWNGEGGSYSEGLKRFFQGKVETVPAHEAQPMVPFAALLKIEALASGLGTLLAEARWWTADLTPLEIIDDAAMKEVV